MCAGEAGNVNGRLAISSSIQGPPHDLPPQPDREPQTARDVGTLLDDIFARREPAGATDAFRAQLASQPGYRALIRNWLQGYGPLAYLGADDVEGRRGWDGRPLARLVYYQTSVKERVFHLTVGMSADGRIGRLDFYYR